MPGRRYIDELIALQPEAWDVRSQEFTPILIRQLEAAFWDRIMTRLDPDTLLLMEFLSVYRKPFRKEAIQRLSEKVSTVDEFALGSVKSLSVGAVERMVFAQSGCKRACANAASGE